MKKFLIPGALMLFSLAFTGCHSNEPDSVEGVGEAAPNTLSGYVTNMKGAAIADAVITVGTQNVTTNKEGYYILSGVINGTYTATVAADGYMPESTTFTIDEKGITQNVQWSVMLSKDMTKTFNVTTAGGGEGNTVTEAVEGNDKGEIKISVNVPGNSVPENTTISVTPVYTEDSELITKAAEDKMLVGANVTCSNPNLVLSNPITVHFDVDSSVTEHVETRMLVNGQWVVVDHANDNTGLSVETRQFGLIGLFFPVTITTRTTSEDLKFAQSKWDNLYGDHDIQVVNPTYTYKNGSQFTVKAANTLEALLIERLANIVGPTYKTLTGVYPINYWITIGNGLYLDGYQAIDHVTVASRNRSVDGIKYGVVVINARLYGREHTGSGSRPQ